MHSPYPRFNSPYGSRSNLDRPPVDKKNMQCYGCGKYGHWRPDCPEKEQSSRSRKSRPPFAAGRGRGRPSFKGGDSRLPSKFNYLSIASDDAEADSTDET